MTEEFSPNQAEFSAEKRIEGRLRMYRWLMVLGYILFSVAYFFACYRFVLIPLVAILPMLLMIIIWFTWRYVNYDTGYRFVSGTMTFFRVYAPKGKRIQRDCVTLQIKDAEAILHGREADGREDKLLDFSASLDDPDAVLLYIRLKGKLCALRFTCTNRLSHLLKLYFPNTALEGKSFRY